MGVKDIMIVTVSNGSPLILIGDVVPENPLKLFLVGSVCTIQIESVNGIFPFGVVPVVIGYVIIYMGRRNGVVVVVIGGEP